MSYEHVSWPPYARRNRGHLSFVAFGLFGFIISGACSQTPDEDRENGSAQIVDEPIDADNARLETEAVRRELLFVKYLGDKAGTSGLNNLRNNQLWANLLDYKGDKDRVVKLTSVYRVFEEHIDAPTITAARELEGSESDSPDSWTISVPTYGTKPMRMFSSLFEVTRNNNSPVFIHLELSFVWENQQWRQLRKSVQEIPRSESSAVQKIAPTAESTDDGAP